MNLVKNTTHQLPPRTAMEVFEMLPEGTLAEVINNTIYMLPAPSLQHQIVIGKLFTNITIFIEANKLGICLVSPVDVYFDGNNALQPDILFISNANMGIIKNDKVKGTPDFVIEVLSLDKKYDLETKKLVYEKFGVKEYFVVEPFTKEVVAFYHDGKKYIAQETKTGKLKSKLLKKTFAF
jgi:Uma2 family endonuclease